MIKNGTRLQSQLCDTEVIVVKTAESLSDLRAGGVAMVPAGEAKSLEKQPDPTLIEGNVMGRRYVDHFGAEVLVTKAGAGTLCTGETPMTVKQAAALPASD